MRETLVQHTTNAVVTGTVREDTFAGRPHLVVPIVAVREMVLGGDGGEFLPAEEIENSVGRGLWEGRPVTIGHPKLNGQPVTAGRRDAAERFEVGRLFSTEHVGDRLRGEVWIDLGRAEEVEGGREAVRLAREASPGRPLLEVSTSYWASREPKTGRHDGIRFSAIQRDLDPDHLALLPGGKGKCSIGDGCGGPRLNDELEENVDQGKLEKATRAIANVLRSLFTAQDGEESAESRLERIRRAVTERFGDEEGFTFVEATFDNRVIFEREIPGNDETGVFAIDLEEDEETGEVTFTGEPREVKKVVTFEPVENTAPEADEEETMDREELITALAENEGLPFDREDLEGFEDERLTALEALVAEGSEETAGGEEEEPGGGEKPKVGGEEETGGTGDEPVTLSREEADYLRALRENGTDPEAIGRMLAEHKARAEAEEAEREKLVKALAANEACPFDEDDLADFDLPKLKKLEDGFRARTYLGRGGPRGRKANEGESYFDRAPTTPAIVTRKPAKNGA